MAAVAQALVADIQLVCRGNQAAVVQALAVNMGFALGGDAAAVVQAVAAEVYCGVVGRADGGFIRRHQLAAVANLAVGAEGNAARSGKDLPGIVHAYALIGADEGDFLGIHAAQAAGVDGHGRGGRGTGRGRIFGGVGCGISRGGGVLTGGIDVVAAGNHVQLFSPNTGVDLRGLGENAGVVGAGSIQTLTAHANVTAAHTEAFQMTVADDGPAGGEGDAGSIDKAAAVHLDTGGVGHNHFGTTAGHFDIAV
nr:hypothetical protein [Paralysiella testudinis]